MRRLAVPLFALAALSACQQKAPAELAVTDAWVRLSPVPGRPAAAYFTIRGAAQADRLLSVQSPKVATIELHEGGMKNGMMTMARIDGADVPAGGTLAFAPGGNHAMLFGVDPSIAPGGMLPLSFRFASGRTLSADARAQAAGDAAPGHDAR